MNKIGQPTLGATPRKLALGLLAIGLAMGVLWLVIVVPWTTFSYLT